MYDKNLLVGKYSLHKLVKENVPGFHYTLYRDRHRVRNLLPNDGTQNYFETKNTNTTKMKIQKFNVELTHFL